MVEARLGDLLSDMDNSVSTLPQGSSVFDVAQEIFLHRKKAVIILDGTKKAKGMVLEQDVAFAINEMGIEIFEKRVEEMMRIDILTCSPQDSLDEGLEVIAKHQIRHLPILSSDGDLRGFVHVEDIVRAKLAQIVVKWRNSGGKITNDMETALSA